MTKLLQVGNDIFEYPQQGTGQGHGEDATAWAEAVTAALADFLGPNDIKSDKASLSNGTYDYDNPVNGSGSVVGLSFNLAEVLHTNVEFLIIRQYKRRFKIKSATFAPDSDGYVTYSDDFFRVTNHGFSSGQLVKLQEDSGGFPAVVGTPLSEANTYKVVVLSDNIFQLTDLNGSLINFPQNTGITFFVVEQLITTLAESGKIYGNYNGTQYNISIESVGQDTLVELDVNSSGQFTYVTTPLPDQSFGEIYFKARTIDR